MLRHRVERAEPLLVETDVTLADVALLCGFADQIHFPRVFSHLSALHPPHGVVHSKPDEACRGFMRATRSTGIKRAVDELRFHRMWIQEDM
jgi:AraC-like DNA-binding protein